MNLGLEKPKDWQLTYIGEIGKITSGGTPSRKEHARYFQDGTIPWIKTTDLNNGEIHFTEEKITPSALNESSCSVLPKGTVLIAMYGGFRQIGRTGITGMQAATNQAISAVVLKHDHVLPVFLLYWLNGNVGCWRTLAGSSRKDPNITKRDVESFPVLLPPFPEQKKIVEVLGTWNEAIEKTEKLIKAKKTLKKGLMQQLLTGKKRFKKFRDTRWKRMHLSELGKCIRGVSYKPEDLQDPESSSTVRLLRANNIQDGRVVLENMQIVPAARCREIQELCNGDILICMSSGSKAHVGKTACFDGDKSCKYTVGAFCAIFRAKSRSDADFLKHFFDSEGYRKQLWVLYAGTNINNLSNKDIERISLTLPEHDCEKQAIGDVLRSMDEEINALDFMVKALRQQKNSLMQKLLTGQIRVTT